MLSFEVYLKPIILGIPLDCWVWEITSKIAPCNSDGVAAQELALVSKCQLPLASRTFKYHVFPWLLYVLVNCQGALPFSPLSFLK